MSEDMCVNMWIDMCVNTCADMCIYMVGHPFDRMYLSLIKALDLTHLSLMKDEGHRPDTSISN